ncbi:MAG: hypothetical protein U9R79_07275 [Armatimonadota bacterium]|nr:hypothetical protein [Armatimonadota bacterium]
MKRRFVMVLIVIGAILLGAAIYGGWRVHRSLAEIKRLNAIADALPSPEELRGPEIPPEQNAAEVYRQAWQALQLSEADETATSKSSSPGTLAPVIDKNRQALRLVAQAAAMDKCRFEPTSFTAGMPDWEHLKHMRRLTRLVLAAARLETVRGNAEAALAHVREAVRIADHLFQSSESLICYLSAVAVTSMSGNALEEVLCDADVSAERSAALREALRELEPVDTYVRSLRFEELLGLRQLEAMGRAGGRGGRGNSVMRLFVGTNRARYVEMMNDLIENADRPYRETADEPASPESVHNPFVALAEILGPVFARANKKRDHAVADIELSAMALDLKAHKHAHGVYPEGLEALPRGGDSDYAVDPFSGERLRYRRDGDGFVLWSLGPDLDDDGGVSRHQVSRAQRGDEDYDLVFTCTR